MHFLIYGEDTYRSRRKLSALRKEFFRKRDAGGLNCAVFKASESDCDEVVAALYASPFLAEKKMVIVEGFLRTVAAEQKKLAEALAKKPASTVVIFFEDCGPAGLEKSNLFPLLKSQPFSDEFAKLAGRDALAFVRDECAAAGTAIEPKAAELVVLFTGGDSWQVHTEIDKAAAYARAAKSPAITADMVRLLVVAGVQDEPIFAYLDACTQGRVREAALALERLLEAGTPEAQIISMLAKQFRTLIAVRDLVDRGERDKFVVAKKLGIHHFPASKAMNACRRLSSEALHGRYRQLIEIDRRWKTGFAKPRTLLQLFTASLAA
ncbi:DNA polymerase III subunit delta [Candidatus Uhrbacteria bacterium]|nr:DNA polymerase III subunit delta [Candidatus Uhrbacteria bacterium]